MTRRAAILILSAVLAAAAAGCDEAAWILVQTIGPFVPEDKHAAEFDLSGKSLLILVDVEDPMVASEYPRVEALLATGIADTLKDYKASGPVVPVYSVQAARRMERGFEQWSVAQAGEYFNVDLVMHVQLFEYRVKDNPSANVLRGYAETAVRLVSPETGRQVWPVLAEARLVTAEGLPEADATPAETSEYEAEVAKGLAAKIARNFCTYKLADLPFRSKVK